MLAQTQNREHVAPDGRGDVGVDETGEARRRLRVTVEVLTGLREPGGEVGCPTDPATLHPEDDDAGDATGDTQDHEHGEND